MPQWRNYSVKASGRSSLMGYARKEECPVINVFNHLFFPSQKRISQMFIKFSA